MKKLYLVLLSCLTLLPSYGSEAKINSQDLNVAPVYIPEGINTTVWTLSYDYTGAGVYNVGHEVEIGFDSSNVYFKNFAGPLIPDAEWIKGEIKDDKIFIPSGQYLGYSPDWGYDGWVVAGKELYGYDPSMGEDRWMYEIYPNVILSYDAENKCMFFENDCFINVNDGKSISYMDVYGEGARLAVQPAEITYTPQNPELLFYSDYDANGIVAMLMFNFPNVTIDGWVLETENLYLRAYVDGEPIEFSPEDYPGLSEPTELLNAQFMSYDYSFARIMFTQYQMYWFIDGMDSIEFQSVYFKDDKEYNSERVLIYGETTGIENLSQENSEIKKIIWRDLTGREIGTPEKGIYIKTVVLNDGSMKSQKVIL